MATLCTEAAAMEGGGSAPQQQQQRIFTLPRQHSLYPPQVLNPFVQEKLLGAKDKCQVNKAGGKDFAKHKNENK